MKLKEIRIAIENGFITDKNWLKKTQKFINEEMSDSPTGSEWSEEEAFDNSDREPFTKFELTILNLLHKNMSLSHMEEALINHHGHTIAEKNYSKIAKLIGLPHTDGGNYSRYNMYQNAGSKKYLKWAIDNWSEDGNYHTIKSPLKSKPKKYRVKKEEEGEQYEYKEGTVEVVAFDEEGARETASDDFYEWGGAMETYDYGDWETYDSDTTEVDYMGSLTEGKKKEFNRIVKLYKLGKKYTPKITGGVTEDTLVDFLKENLNNMVYRETPKDKDIDRMNQSLGPIEGFPIEMFKGVPPPRNESTQTEEEIEYLDGIVVEDELIHSADAIDSHFKKFLNSKNLEYPKKELKKVMGGIKSIILQLKYHYNRPRPSQVARAKNLKLNSKHLESATTPSYPSGHATQGTFIGRYLADLYPKYEKELRQIGEDIAFSRNMAKVHYPSDSEFGKTLGTELYDFVYQPKMDLSEQLEEGYRRANFNRHEENDGETKLLVPTETLYDYGDKYLKEGFKKDLIGILDCMEKTCYNIGDINELPSDEGQNYNHNCNDCSEALNNTLQSVDREFIKMGFLNHGHAGWLEKPFPVQYNVWIEGVIQEVNPNYFIDDNDEVSYNDLGNSLDAYYVELEKKQEWDETANEKVERLRRESGIIREGERRGKGENWWERNEEEERGFEREREGGISEGDAKLLVPKKVLFQYLENYHKDTLKKHSTPLLDCIEKTCYQNDNTTAYRIQIGEDTCNDCNDELNDILELVDSDLVKMGFLKPNKVGKLRSPFPKDYNYWIEGVLQEINPNYYIDDNDEVSYNDNFDTLHKELDEKVLPNKELKSDENKIIKTFSKLKENNLGKRIKTYTTKKKLDIGEFWQNLVKGAQREKKETAEAVKILGRLLGGKEKPTKDEIKFLKSQSADIAKIIGVITLGAVSVVIPLAIEKVLNKYGVSILPKKQNDGDGDGIPNEIDDTQDNNLNEEVFSGSHKLNSPILDIGDEIIVVDLVGENEGWPKLFEPYVVTATKWATYPPIRFYELEPIEKSFNAGCEQMPCIIYEDTASWIIRPGFRRGEIYEDINKIQVDKMNQPLNNGDIVRILDVNKTTPLRWDSSGALTRVNL